MEISKEGKALLEIEKHQKKENGVVGSLKDPMSLFLIFFCGLSCSKYFFSRDFSSKILPKRFFFPNLEIVKLGGFIAFPALCQSKGCDDGCGARSWY